MTDPLVLTLVGLGGMIALILFHVPIGVAMGISGFVGFGLLSGFAPAVTLFGSETSAILKSQDLAVVPLFLLMGSLASASGLSADIYRLAHAFAGHRRGGLAIATIGGCAGFGAVCGSSPATAATMGRIALPEMLDRGYAPSLATGCIAAGGTLGMLIPPSIVMIIYAYLAEQFVITLFIAALLPAAIAIALHIVAIAIYVRVYPNAAPAVPAAPWSERWRAARRSWGVVLMMTTVIGGLYSGIFTVTEAASVGVAIAFIFTVARGCLNRTTANQILVETASNSAMIYIIVIGASIFTFFITVTRLPDNLSDMIIALNLPPYGVILVLVLIYLVLGAVFETVSSMLITLPFVLPLVLDLGFDPIWWGIVLVMVIELGMISPPIGMNVFILHGIARNVSLGTIFRGATPFLIADLVRISIIIAFPILTLWLPRVLS